LDIGKQAESHKKQCFHCFPSSALPVEKRLWEMDHKMKQGRLRGKKDRLFALSRSLPNTGSGSNTGTMPAIRTAG
jgi:hypothetical protein